MSHINIFYLVCCMTTIQTEVRVFDPGLPFDQIITTSIDFNTWYDHTIISRDLRAKLPNLQDNGTSLLWLPSGIKISLPTCEIGLQIGSLRVERVAALVADASEHDVIIGSNVFAAVFNVDHANEDTGVRTVSTSKDDPTALSIELYPVHMPMPLQHLEIFLRS